jgi:aminoglycoside 2'-N-acetyltransferase I
MVRVFPTAEASCDLLDEIRRLLDAAFAGQLTDEDWEHTIGGRHIVVQAGDADGEIVAHAAVVPRILEAGGRFFRTGYVEGVATAPKRQGFGTLAMTEAGELIRRDFEIGALGTDAHEFYERLGWEHWRGPTYVRRGSGVTRSKADDDGVMVLRFGPSRAVELTTAISCEERPGDDW